MYTKPCVEYILSEAASTVIREISHSVAMHSAFYSLNVVVQLFPLNCPTEAAVIIYYLLSRLRVKNHAPRPLNSLHL